MLARFFVAVLILVIAGLAGFFAWAWHGEIVPEQHAATSFDSAIVARGANLAAIGSCVVCHTTAGSPSYAGGYPVATPFGTVYGSNITPDPDTGIGLWSAAAFRRAMRQGVDRQGRHLYPAFPYDHFTHATDADLDAVYAFIMTRDPMRQQDRPPDLIFPFNIRLFAAGWKLLFLHRNAYASDDRQSPQWNRGAYLAETFGHCGACHTPRNALGAEKHDKAYAGGVAEGWRAPALNAASPAPVPWSAQAAFDYLRHGWDHAHGYAAGPMQPVVDDLTRANEDDVQAIAVYIASLNGKATAANAQASAQAAQQRTLPIHNSETTGSANANDPGAALFAGACATCHHRGGRFPMTRPIDLALSSPVNAPDPLNLLWVILNGIHPAPNEHGPIMPGFDGALSDPQIVALVNYVRSHFSGKPQWGDAGARLDDIRTRKNL